MEIVLLIGRILFALIFIGSGIGHLVDVKSTAAAAARRGVEPAALMARLSGVVLLLCGVGVAFGIFMDVAALGIVGILLIFAFKMHPFWSLPAAEKEMEMAHFMKNISLTGAALIVFVLSGAMPYTITRPLLGL